MSELTEVKVSLQHLNETVKDLKNKIEGESSTLQTVATGLAQLNGSLKILLEDREKHAKTMERIHDRIDEERAERKESHDAHNARLTKAEAEIAVLKSSHSANQSATRDTKAVLWDVGRIVAAALVGAVFAIFSHKSNNP